MGWSISHTRTSRRKWDCLPWRKPMGVFDEVSEDSQTLLSGGIQWQKQRTQTPVEQETPIKHKENLFLCEGVQTLEQVAQRSCGVSILRDTKKANWTQPWETCSKWPCSEYGVGLATSSSASNPVVWWSCDYSSICRLFSSNETL